MPSLRIEVSGQVVFARLGDAVVRVGRDPTCDLRIDDTRVSATHLSIEPLPGGGHKLTDLNSGLPTKVNGFVVKRVSLRPGDVIEVGPARIVYDPEAAPAATAPPPVVPAARPVVAAPVAAAPDFPPAAAQPARAAAVSAVAPAALASADAAPSALPRSAADPADTADAHGADAMPAAPVATPASVRVRSSSSRLKTALVVTGTFAVVALVVAALIRGSGDSTSDLRQLRVDLDRAKALAPEDVDRALTEFDRLSRAPSDGIRRQAVSEAEFWRQRIRDADHDIADLERRAPNLDAEAIDSDVALLKQRYGEGLVRRHAGLEERLASLRRNAAQARSASAIEQSRALADAGKLADGLALWDTLLASAPNDDALRRTAEEERSAIDAKATEAFKTLATEVDDVSRKDGPRAAAMRLRARLPDFAGTSVATAIARRAASYDAYAVAAAAAAARASRHAASSPPTGAAAKAGTGRPPTPTPGPEEPTAKPPAGAAPTPPPSVPGPPSLPPPTPINRARLVALVAEADAKAAARRFREALATLLEADKFAEGTTEAGRLVARKDDLDLARRGLDTLAAAVKEHPDRFQAVEIAPKYVVALVDADSEMLTAAVRGGRVQTKWSSLDAAHTASLVDAAAPAPKDGLPLAALLREVGAKDASERLLFRAVESGGDHAAIDERLARWRGEPVPSGGYVPYEGRLVSPAERERLALEARIAAACLRVASPSPKERRAAYDELLSLGPPAREAFAKALRARRDAATKEVAGSKAFTAGRTRQRLVDELEKRRAAALAVIDDPVAYPYPYAPDQEQRQKRVNDLVDAVREVWERPFDLVSSWDKSVEQSLGLVREVDDVLAKVEEGYVADVDAVKAEVNKAIDLPGHLLDPYDRDVLAFNEKVPTSATGQEKENVRIVNRYRMMMGRKAVRIEERLVRAARGHSIEMRVKDYFAHESPTPGLQSPGQRSAREGYSAGVGENIAMSSGGMDAQGAFDGWFHSSGHHRNMLGKGWTELGVGRSGGSGTKTMWTQNFGAQGGSSLKMPDPLPPPRDDVRPEKDPETGEASGEPTVPNEPVPNEPGMDEPGGGEPAMDEPK